MIATQHRPSTTPNVAPRMVRLVWGLLLAVLAGGPILYALLAPRGYASASLPGLGTLSPGSVKALISLLAIGEVAVAGAVVVLALPVARVQRRGTGAALWAVALGMSVYLSAWFNAQRFTVGLSALPLTALAMILFPPPPLEWFEALVRRMFRVVVWGSLAAWAAAPSWAAQQGYDTGIIPGLHSRLAGLTTHPNALGPIAAALVVLEWRRRPRSIPVGLALLVLLWTQSKTSWAALAVVVGVALFRRLRVGAPRRPWVPVVMVLVVIGTSGYLALGLLGNGQDTVRTDNNADTFTGRTSIWEVTLEVWQDNPVVGYGPDLWGDAMDRRYRFRVGFPPGHAHNELIHVLGETGVVGATALLGLLLALGALARRGDRATRGVALALFVILMVTCFSEVPLRSVPFNANFLLSLSTFGYLVIAANTADDG